MAPAYSKTSIINIKKKNLNIHKNWKIMINKLIHKKVIECFLLRYYLTIKIVDICFRIKW